MTFRYYTEPALYQDSQQICENGHRITLGYYKYEDSRRKFCAKCGAPTIHECAKCKTGIPGQVFETGSPKYNWDEIGIPNNCENCGNPFPWAGKKKALAPAFAATELAENICRRFHLVATQLRTRRDKRLPLEMVDEYDVQYLLHGLLKLHFDDVRPEERTPSFAGSSSTIDFLLKDQSIALETKKTRPGFTEKQIGEELIVDIAK